MCFCIDTLLRKNCALQRKAEGHLLICFSLNINRIFSLFYPLSRALLSEAVESMFILMKIYTLCKHSITKFPVRNICLGNLQGPLLEYL